MSPPSQPSRSSLADSWRRLVQRLKGNAPFVRRREYKILQRKHAALADAIHRGIPAASDAAIDVRQAVGAMSGDVCVFVTHAPQRVLKSHVRHHIEHLLGAGLKVVLVVNADLPLAEFTVDAELASRLSGLYVRANQGYDFAAWGHVLGLCDRTAWRRLYLVNDSLVGPLDKGDFDRLVTRFEECKADIAGLTRNPVPVPHLQSFFLVFNRRAIHSATFDDMVRHMRSLRDKGDVVDVYELRLTRTFEKAGFTTQAIVESVRGGPVAGDPVGEWEALLAAGVPYVKTRVLKDQRNDPRMREIRAAAKVDAQV